MPGHPISDNCRELSDLKTDPRTIERRVAKKIFVEPDLRALIRGIKTATETLRMSILRRMNQFPDGVSKDVERDRLVQNDIYCGRFCTIRVDLSAEAGQQDDRNVVVHLLDEARSLLAVHFRHGAVHHHKIEMPKPKFFERFAST